MLNLRQIPVITSRILPDHHSVSRPKTSRFYKVVGMWLIGSSAETRVGFNPCLSELPILNQAKRLAQWRKEGEPVLQDQDIAVLLLL